MLAVNPASYAALVSAAQGYPAVPAGLLAVPGTPGAAQPVLASPQAAADLGRGPVSISTRGAAVRPVTVRVAGEVSATPGWPAGGAFLIMPLAAVKSTAVPPAAVPVTELLLTGLRHRPGPAGRGAAEMPCRPGGAAIFRVDVLAELTSAPLQHGAFLLFTLSVVARRGPRPRGHVP